VSGTFHARPDWQRLRDQVLAPLRAGRRAPGVPPRTAVMIIDGTASIRPELAPYYHLRVFVDTPADIRALRLEDGEPEDPRDDHYLRTSWPQTRAHLLVRGY
jgi:uridine kinase